MKEIHCYSMTTKPDPENLYGKGKAYNKNNIFEFMRIYVNILFNNKKKVIFPNQYFKTC